MRNNKILSSFLISIVVFCIGSSCHRNRLKTNEKELAKEIQSQAEKANLQSDNMQLLPDMSRKGPHSFRQKEIRSVDPVRPPVNIDIAGNLNNIKEIKLSDIASEIKYIRLEQIPDSGFKRNIGFMYHLTDDFIIAVNFYGIVQYTRDGRFVRTIVKNEFTNMQAIPHEDGSYGVMSYSDHTFIGSGDIKVRIEGNILNYSYENNIAGQEFLMQFDCSELQTASPSKFDPEDPLKITGLGKPIVDFNHGRMSNVMNQLKSKGIWSSSAPIQGFSSQSYAITWINNDTYSKKLRGDNMIGIFNKYGDTLSVFTQYERLVNYTKSVQRGTDSGSQYEFNNKVFFRNAFNDTICQIVPPNRLLPVYVLNLGNCKVTRQQGVDPSFDLTGKIIIEDWAETKKFILLTFTKDNYDCPANRQSKKVKIYYAMFSKEGKQFNIIKSDPLDYNSEILKNDIDGGIPVWPSYYQIGKDGEIILSVKGKTLKKRVRSMEFKESLIPESRKDGLKRMAASASDYDDIVMLIK